MQVRILPGPVSPASSPMLDLNQCLFLDFEARSHVDITEVGAYAYAQHPTTEILCCGWVIGLDAPVEMWTPDEPLPPAFNDLNRTWVAQNKDTERMMLRYQLDIHPRHWVDLATWASAAGMPRNLHAIGEALGLSVEKGAKTSMLAFARQAKATKRLPARWAATRETHSDMWANLIDYCRTDVDVMRKACTALPKYEWVLPSREQRLQKITDDMNDRGVPVDMDSVYRAKAVCQKHLATLRAEWDLLYPGVNPRHAPSAAAALGIDNAQKDTVRDALKFEKDPRRRRGMELLKTIKTASIAKLDSFIEHVTSDNRLHGSMVFHGAGRTGRWSSMGVQLHNLVRGLQVSTPDWPAIDKSKDAMETFFECLRLDIVDLVYDNPTRAVASAMRGFLIGEQDE